MNQYRVYFKRWSDDLWDSLGPFGELTIAQAVCREWTEKYPSSIVGLHDAAEDYVYKHPQTEPIQE